MITQNDEKLVNDLDCSGVEFLAQEKDFSKIETTKAFASMCFVMRIN